MDSDSFKSQMGCSFSPDDREVVLFNRISNYYKDTENLSNKSAYLRWREFREWAISCGYTSQEINRAKRLCEQG